MKAKGLIGIFCVALVAVSISAQAQVYSQNIVGYYNLLLSPGNNLIANQLSNGGNTLDEFLSQNTPDGATFALWDPTSGQYLPTSTYQTGSGWSINYALTYGEGGLLNTPSAFSNTFVGSVSSAFNTGSDQFSPPLVTGDGTFLLSCYIPIGSATFYDVVGRNPLDGESVSMLNPLTQITTTTTFDGGVWNNGDPTLNVGQSAFFTLVGPIDPTPEPSTYVLSGGGFLLLATLKRFRRN